MNFLQEAIASYRRLDKENDPEDDQNVRADDVNVGNAEDLPLDLDLEDPEDGREEQQPDAVPDFDEAGTGEPHGDEGDDEEDPDGLTLDDSGEGDENPELDGAAADAAEDPDRAGLIRAIPKAHLVYKRETEDGTYEELWIYNVDTLRDEIAVRKAILAGTDIPVNKTKSPDGSQEYNMWSAGNAEMLLVTGLTN